MNKLFTKIATFSVGLAMAVGVGVAVGSGKEATRVSAVDVGDLVYTLSGSESTGGNSSPHNNYASAADSTQSSKTWSVTANSNMTPWRLGGKNITDTDRAIYSKTAIDENIAKIEVESGTSTLASVNSLTITVHSSAADAASGDNAIATKQETDSGKIIESTVTLQKADSTSWAGKFYRIVYNVTQSTNSNKYIQFISAKFYETASACTHNWVAGTVHAPTCENQGYTEYECSLCGKTKNDSYVDPLGHDYGEWEITTPATCTSTGEKTRVCSHDANHTETETIPLIPHNYVDGICTECGAVEPAYLIVSPSDGTAVDGGTTGSPFNITKYCISIDVTGTLTASEARVFKGKTMTISGVTIKKVEFTCTAQDTTKQGPGCFGTGAPEGYTYDGYVGTWEGSSNSISFTAVDNQVRITEFRIYIAAEGFASLITDKINCVSAGTSEPSYVSGYSWSVLNSIYNTLDSTEKGILRAADYTKTGTGSSTVVTPKTGTTQKLADAMAKYDYIVGKYNPTGSLTSPWKNFISRTITPINGSLVMPGANIDGANAATTITVVVSMISLTTIAGYAILRKRKIK